jgi:hypothetical protein
MAQGFYIYTADPNTPPCGFKLAWTGTDPEQFQAQLDNFTNNGPDPWDWGSYDTAGPVPLISHLGPNVLTVWIHRDEWQNGFWFNSWTGTSYPQLLEIVSSLEAQGYRVKWYCYPAGSAPPPPPPPVCPPGTTWDPTTETCKPTTNPPPPPPPPPDDAVDDEIVLLLEFVIQLLEKLGPQTGGGGNDACCKAITLAVTSISTQLVNLIQTIKTLGGKPPVVNIDLAAVVNAIDGVSKQLAADDACCKQLDADLQAINTTLGEIRDGGADPNVKRIADTLNGFPPDEPGATDQLNAVIDQGVKKYGFPSDLAQLLKS